MKKNIGTKDRLLRFALALLIGVGMFFFDLMIIKIILALLLLFVIYEVLVGWCAFYEFIGKNTCPINLGGIHKKN